MGNPAWIDPETGEVLEPPPDSTSQQETKGFMCLDDLRGHLSKQHGITVGKDDPILLVHTIHQLMLEQLDKAFRRHDRALTEAMTDVLAKAIKGLTTQAIAENLDRQVRLADRTQAEFERQYRRARLLSMVNLASMAVCVPVLIYIVLK